MVLKKIYFTTLVIDLELRKRIKNILLQRQSKKKSNLVKLIWDHNYCPNSFGHIIIVPYPKSYSISIHIYKDYFEVYPDKGLTDYPFKNKPPSSLLSRFNSEKGKLDSTRN
jgi:hypothetical protein